MRRSTRWIINGYYYVSLLLGLLSFCYDRRKGVAHTRISVTIYCGVLSLAMFGIVPIVLQVDWKLTSNIPNEDLHIQISALMCLLQIVAVLVSITWNWTKRGELISTFNEYQQLREEILQKWPLSQDIEVEFEKTLRRKFVWSIASYVSYLLSTWDFFKTEFHMTDNVVAALAFVCSILGFIMAHFFFVAIHHNLLMAIINREVKRILKYSAFLFEQQRRKIIRAGQLMSQCHKLSKDLDMLAIAQYSLLRLAQRINAMYDVQGVCIILFIYLNNVSCVYISYMMLQHQAIFGQYETGSWVSLSVAVVIYYTDLSMFVLPIFQLIGLVEETGELLKDRQTWVSTLDKRLDKSFKNFSLQLAKFPVDMKLVGLFKFDRSMAFSIFGSTISNAIVLMQYDYKYKYD